jgi:Rrf2 family protein
MLAKTTGYAIRALVYIYMQNQAGKRPGFKEIAQKIDSPEQFTAKILQNLARVELVCSAKGRGGGFFFCDSSVPLSLYDVILKTEGEDVFSDCGFGLGKCDSENPCPLHDEYSLVRDGFYELAAKQSIQVLADKINENKAKLSRL